MFCVTVFLAAALLRNPARGLRQSVVLAASLCLTAALLRALPAVVLSAAARARHARMIVAITHVAQILNASAAPLVVASPSYLSLHWFSERERNTATAVANSSNALGRAIGFFLGPAMVHAAGDLNHLLLLEIGLAALPLICVVVYYPSMPPAAPSAAAALARRRDEAAAAQAPAASQTWGAARSLGADLGALLTNGSCMAIIVAGGLQMGVFGAWSGVLPQVLPFSDARNGYFGAANTFASIAGSLLVGLVTDVPFFHKRVQATTLVVMAVASILFVLFALPLSYHVLPAHYGPLMAVCTLAGLFRGAADPLFFELAAETAYPINASTAGGTKGKKEERKKKRFMAKNRCSQKRPLPSPLSRASDVHLPPGGGDITVDSRRHLGALDTELHGAGRKRQLCARGPGFRALRAPIARVLHT